MVDESNYNFVKKIKEYLEIEDEIEKLKRLKHNLQYDIDNKFKIEVSVGNNIIIDSHIYFDKSDDEIIKHQYGKGLRNAFEAFIKQYLKEIDIAIQKLRDKQSKLYLDENKRDICN